MTCAISAFGEATTTARPSKKKTSGPEFPNSRKLNVENLGAARDRRELLTGQISRAEHDAPVGLANLDIEDKARSSRRALHSLVDIVAIQARVIGTQPRLHILKLGQIQQIQGVDHVAIEQIKSHGNKAGQCHGRDDRVPKHQPSPERPHTIL